MLEDTGVARCVTVNCSGLLHERHVRLGWALEPAGRYCIVCLLGRAVSRTL